MLTELERTARLAESVTRHHDMSQLKFQETEMRDRVRDFEEEREVEKEQRMTIMIASSEKVQTTADRKTLPEWRQSYGGGVCTARPRMARSMGCSCCILTCCCA